VTLVIAPRTSMRLDEDDWAPSKRHAKINVSVSRVNFNFRIYASV
jgi:hypothetical protein